MPWPLFLLAGTAVVTGLGANIGLHKHYTLDNAFDPEKQAKMLEKYREDIGLGSDFTYSAGAFDQYVKTRDENVANLETVFKDKKVQEAIKKSEPLRKALEQALVADPGKPDPSDAGKKIGGLGSAQAEYEETAKVFGGLLKKQPPFKAEQLIQAMTDLRKEGVENIEKQQAFERTALSEKLKDEAMVAELKAQGVTPESVLKELDKVHAAQMKAFKDSTAASLQQLHDAAEKEMMRVIFLGTIAQYNKEMRAELGRLAEEKRDKGNLPPPILVGGIGTDPKNPDVGVLQISDLRTIHTRTGKTFTQDENGELTLEMGRILTNPMYYLFGNQPESDMEDMARMIKAKGHKSIEMDVNIDDEELAKARAQQAFEACVKAGFPLDKIKINVNGVDWTADKDLNKRLEKIYGEGSNMPATLKKRSEEIIAQDKKVIEVKTGGNADPVKQEAIKLRTEMKAAEAEAARKAAEEAAKKKADDEAEQDVTIAPHQ